MMIFTCIDLARLESRAACSCGKVACWDDGCQLLHSGAKRTSSISVAQPSLRAFSKRSAVPVHTVRSEVD